MARRAASIWSSTTVRAPADGRQPACARVSGAAQWLGELHRRPRRRLRGGTPGGTAGGVQRVDMLTLDDDGNIAGRQQDVPFVAESGGVVVSPEHRLAARVAGLSLALRLLAVDARARTHPRRLHVQPLALCVAESSVRRRVAFPLASRLLPQNNLAPRPFKTHPAAGASRALRDIHQSSPGDGDGSAPPFGEQPGKEVDHPSHLMAPILLALPVGGLDENPRGQRG